MLWNTSESGCLVSNCFSNPRYCWKSSRQFPASLINKFLSRKSPSRRTVSITKIFRRPNLELSIAGFNVSLRYVQVPTLRTSSQVAPFAFPRGCMLVFTCGSAGAALKYAWMHRSPCLKPPICAPLLAWRECSRLPHNLSLSFHSRKNRLGATPRGPSIILWGL